MGVGEKLTVVGVAADGKTPVPANVDDLRRRGDAFLSDITSSGDLTVTTGGSTFLNLRNPRSSSGTPPTRSQGHRRHAGTIPGRSADPDTGVDFFANGNISFSKAPLAAAGHQQPDPHDTGDLLHRFARFGTGTGASGPRPFAFRFNNKLIAPDDFFLSNAAHGNLTTALDFTPPARPTRRSPACWPR